MVLKIIPLLARLALMVLIGSGCAGNSLIRRWDEDFYRRHSYQPFPKRIEFKRDDHRLMYVATQHKALDESKSEIAAAFREFRPDVVIIEGIHANWGVSPRQWDEQLEKHVNRPGWEAHYAYQRAIELLIPFVGAEPGRMADFCSYDRDVSVVQSLETLKSQYKRVMIVYGAGHFVQEELALERAWGHPLAVK